MKKLYFTLALVLCISMATDSRSQDGKILYDNNCKACHSIGQGNLLGPDLVNISQKREHTWLVQFIKSSKTLIESGDAEAVALFEQFNGLPMPDQALTDVEVDIVIDYIKSESAKLGGASAEEVVSQPDFAETVNEADITRGRELFVGETRFANKGVSCMACHLVNDNELVWGGNMAKQLNDTYRLMGAAGVKAMLQNPPFPAMAVAYRGKSISDEEVHALTAYLMYVSQNQKINQDYQITVWFVLIAYGILAIILSIISILWYKRKQKSVFEEIRQRQPYRLK